MRFSFKQLVPDKDIMVSYIEDLLCLPKPNDIDVEVTVEEALVTYFLDLDIREDGIRNSTVTVNGVSANIHWTVDKEGLTTHEYDTLSNLGLVQRDIIEGFITMDTKGGAFKDYTIADGNFQFNGNLSVSNIDIDFRNKKIIIE